MDSGPGTSTAGVLPEKSKEYVAIEWAGMVVVDIHVYLDGVGDYVRRYFPRQVLVLGDFNAHSSQWKNTGLMLVAGY